MQFPFIITDASSDMTPPIVTNCPQSITYNLPPSTTSREVTWSEPTAVDNSGSIPAVTQSHQPGDVFVVGSTEVTYVFTDQSGNEATCSFVINLGKDHFVSARLLSLNYIPIKLEVMSFKGKPFFDVCVCI